jgi:hypothetical protein
LLYLSPSILNICVHALEASALTIPLPMPCAALKNYKELNILHVRRIFFIKNPAGTPLYKLCKMYITGG